MKLIFFLLRTSWPVALLSAVVGGISGAASVAVVVMILRTVADPDGSTAALIGLFAALCAVVLLTRIVSQLLICRLTQTSLMNLQMGLCRRILDSPVKHLEEIGSSRMLASLTDDVGIISQTMRGVPALGVNFVILACGAAYLASLSFTLFLAAVGFCVLGVASYWYSSKWAQRYTDRAREERNVLQQRVQELIEGVKELKMHHARRHEFVEDVLLATETSARRSQFIGDSVQDAAVSWGRLMFFFAIGLLLFVWPRISHVDTATLNGYVLIILYLMSPLEQIMGWLPYMNWAAAAVRQIERLGLMLDQNEPKTTAPALVRHWEQIEFVGVTHAYRRQGQPHGFTLGPVNLTLTPGEIVFVTGGNGSGKTTLVKLITGLYQPESGEMYWDGQLISADSREAYRQLFSVVFDDAVVFDSLWGIDAADRDQRAQEYLRQFELDHVVAVTHGEFSTTSLSRGQRKRLALLTAYLENRPIYIFDEWAADQDPAFRRTFYLRLLPELKRRGKTVVAITHDDRYFASADRIFKLEEGKVIESFYHEAPQEAQLEML
ncbi:MAG: cyclic peptide export ABC transporter [Planctomycetaceae bacterium]